MSMTPSHTSQQSGFTIVVIAALFVAFAVVIAAVVERNNTLQNISRRNEAADQLNRLSYAIIEYSVFNKSGTNLLYPCPALPNVLPSDANFGKEVTVANLYAADCSSVAGDVVGNPSATVTGLEVLGAAGSSTIRGMVPVQALTQYGIGINDAFDPWNNRIMYVVNRNVTRGASFAQATTITISNPRPAFATLPSPDFLLISYGRDGLGGIKRTSTTIGIPCGATATSAIYRYENCDSDATFYNTSSYIADGANATATPPTSLNTFYFDDIVSYYRQ